MFYKCKCKLVSHKATTQHCCGMKSTQTASCTIERKNQFKTHDANDASRIIFPVFFVPIRRKATDALKKIDEMEVFLFPFFIYLIGKLLSKINE